MEHVLFLSVYQVEDKIHCPGLVISQALYSLKIKTFYIDLDGLWSYRFVFNILKSRQLLDNILVTKNRALYYGILYPCNQNKWASENCMGIC